MGLTTSQMKTITSLSLVTRVVGFRVKPSISISTGDSVVVTEGETDVLNLQYNTIRFGPNVNWSILSGFDGELFQIVNGVLKFKNTPSYSVPEDSNLDNEYIVKVLCRESSGVQDTITYYISVIPEIFVGTLSEININDNEIASNATEGTQVTGITWSHNIDGSPMFELTDDAGGRFSIIPETGTITRTSTGTLGSTHNVTVKVSNEVGSYATATITITVTAAVAPQITSNGAGATAEIEVAEGETAVTTITASAADLVFSISGTDSDDFTIDASSGVLAFSATPDYASPTDANTDNNYSVTVEVTDGVRSDSQALTVSVTEASAGIGFVPGTEITAMRTESMTTAGCSWADASGTYGQSLTGTDWWQMTHDGTTEGFIYVDPVDNSAFTGLGETYFVAMEVKKIAGNVVQPGMNVSSGPFPFADIHTSPSSPTIASGTGGVRQDLDDQYTIWMELPSGAVTENLFLHMGKNGDNSPSGVNALSGEAFLIGGIWLEAKGAKTEPTAVLS